MASNPLVSIIVPTLNECRHLPALIRRLSAESGCWELIIADGGSQDGSLEVLPDSDAIRPIRITPPGRARQMNAGAREARGEILFFLHADSTPPPGFLALIRQTLSDSSVLAGAFFLRFDQPGWLYRMISRVTRLNYAWITYGDQGLFLRRQTFRDIGGFREMPIFEDVDMQRRLRRRGRVVKLPHPILTSARRFEENGPWRQALVDLGLLIGYYAGLPAQQLKRWYPDQR